MQHEKHLKDFIVIIPDVISTDFSKSIIERCDRLTQWQSGTMYGELGKQVLNPGRKCDVLPISQVNECADIDKLLFNIFSDSIKNYFDKFKNVGGIYSHIEKDSGYDLLRYKKGDYLRQHVDHSAKANRIVSCSITLNDDYEGGEWSFWNGDYVVKPPMNSVILFPSNFVFPHAINTVTDGVRYSILTWFS